MAELVERIWLDVPRTIRFAEGTYYKVANVPVDIIHPSLFIDILIKFIKQPNGVMIPTLVQYRTSGNKNPYWKLNYDGALANGVRNPGFATMCIGHDGTIVNLNKKICRSEDDFNVVLNDIIDALALVLPNKIYRNREYKLYEPIYDYIEKYPDCLRGEWTLIGYVNPNVPMVQEAPPPPPPPPPEWIYDDVYKTRIVDAQYNKAVKNEDVVWSNTDVENRYVESKKASKASKVSKKISATWVYE